MCFVMKGSPSASAAVKRSMRHVLPTSSLVSATTRCRRARAARFACTLGMASQKKSAAHKQKLPATKYKSALFKARTPHRSFRDA